MSEEEIPGNKRSMHGNILTYSRFEGRTFKLCVLIGWDFNFCVRSSLLRGPNRHMILEENFREKKKKREKINALERHALETQNSWHQAEAVQS